MPIKVTHFTTMEVYLEAFLHVEPRSLKVALSEKHETMAKGVIKLCVLEIAASKSQVGEPAREFAPFKASGMPFN